MSAASYKITEMIPSTSAHLIDRSKVSLSYKTINTVVSSLYHQKNVKSLIDSAVLHWTTWLMVFPRNAGFGLCYLVSTQNPGRFRFNKNSGLKFRKLHALNIWNGTFRLHRPDPSTLIYCLYPKEYLTVEKGRWKTKGGGILFRVKSLWM